MAPGVLWPQLQSYGLVVCGRFVIFHAFSLFFSPKPMDDERRFLQVADFQTRQTRHARHRDSV